MIESRSPSMLRTPRGDIIFRAPSAVPLGWIPNEATPFHLTKASTAFDERRDEYEYPLDDGTRIGEAYAGRRVWSFEGIIKAETRAEVEAAKQKLRSGVNALLRADGLYMFQGEGFPPVQSTVRRLGSIDFTAVGASAAKFSFQLVAGDPRVYSQDQRQATIVPGVLNWGTGRPVPTTAGDTEKITAANVTTFEAAGGHASSNLISQEQSTFDTTIGGWALYSGGMGSISRATEHKVQGTHSLKLAQLDHGDAPVFAACDYVLPGGVTGHALTLSGAALRTLAGSFGTIVNQGTRFSLRFLDGAGNQIGAVIETGYLQFVSWGQWSFTTTVPSGAAKIRLSVRDICVTLGDMNPMYEGPSDYLTTLYLDDIRLRDDTVGIPYSSQWRGEQIDRATEKKYAGSYSLKADSRVASPKVTVTPGTTVVTKAWVRGISDAAPGNTYGKTFTLVGFDASGNRSVLHEYYGTFGGAWAPYNITVLIPTGVVALAWRVSDPPGPGQPMFVDSFSVTERGGSPVTIVTVDGDTRTPAEYHIKGAIDDPVLLNDTTREWMRLAPLEKGSSNVIKATSQNPEILEVDAVGQLVANRWGKKPAAHPIPDLAPGTNELYASDDDLHASFAVDVYWRDAWLP